MYGLFAAAMERIRANTLARIVGHMTQDDIEMVEIAPGCYLNRTAFDLGLHKFKTRMVASDEGPKNVPIGNSLTPWRKWHENLLVGWYVPWKRKNI